MAFGREVAGWAAQIAVLLFATSTLAQPFVIPSGSMEGTLMTGDHVIVDKLMYSPPGALTSKVLPYRDVERGDIIVFRYPVDIQQNFVKRVIGVPGDRIHMQAGIVYRNGRRLQERYVQHIARSHDAYRDDFPQVDSGLLPPSIRENILNGELVVPAGRYFAMGDNRDNSSDSRYWGLVPRENIVGTPVIVLWSYDAPTEDLLTFRLSHFVDMGLHLFSKTRWDRTMHLVRPAEAAQSGE